MARLSVIIPAAGSGVRMGSSLPKPFIRLGDKTILEHTISRFLAYDDLIQIIIASKEKFFFEIEKIFKNLKNPSVQFHCIEGGQERQFSILNGLKHVDAKAELIAVHDAVRPFIREDQIRGCCEYAKKYGGAVLGVPAKDTIKRVREDQIIEATPDRSSLWQAQTPQIFQKDLLLKAYNSAIEDKFVGTDDASLVERIGGKVCMVKGNRENLKITYPIDLKVAELILRNQE